MFKNTLMYNISAKYNKTRILFTPFMVKKKVYVIKYFNYRKRRTICEQNLNEML